MLALLRSEKTEAANQIGKVMPIVQLRARALHNGYRSEQTHRSDRRPFPGNGGMLSSINTSLVRSMEREREGRKISHWQRSLHIAVNGCNFIRCRWHIHEKCV